MTIDELRQEYLRLAHAVQTGVAYSMKEHADVGRELGAASPKHLRTGLECRAADMLALVNLLLSKGIITEQEYYEALVDAMRAEVATYEQRLSQQHGGANIKLG